MKWYKAILYWNEITEVEVEKFTEVSVWVKGRRNNILSPGHSLYCKTREEAVEAIHELS